LDNQNGTGNTAILEFMETDFSGLTLKMDHYHHQQQQQQLVK
jgi:hypothetical protein